MPDLTLIAQALDFIENNLREPIGVANMADAVGYSLYHFCRTFNEATHHTPYNYLMRRRLSEAARALLQTDATIIDVALDYQFSNPETFSRAFKRIFETQPSQWRKEGSLDRWRLMPRLTAAHLEYIGKGLYRKPVLAERETFRLAGLMTLVQEDRAAVSELWHLLDRELRQRAICAEAGDRYGLCWYPAGWQERGFLYMAAVEMYEPDVACTPLVVNALPALTWVRFLHKGPLRDLSFTLEYVYHTWLPKSEKRTSLPCNVERYGKRFPNADDQESEIEIYFPIE